MARIDTLSHFLTDVADAIRTKKGTQETIQASSFDTEIENLPSGTNLNDYLNLSIDNDSNSYVGGQFWCKVLKRLDNVGITSNVTKLISAFENQKSLIFLTFSNDINTSNVTDMGRMFGGCSSLRELNLSRFNTSNVTDMSYMFYQCSSLTTLNIENFDTSEVTNMSNMFLQCREILAIPTDVLDTSNVETMNYMFGSCAKVETLDLSNFNTSNVTNMSGMFQGCESLTSLDLSGFDTSIVSNINNMFASCISLEHLDIRNMIFNNISNKNTIFGQTLYRTSIPINCEIIVNSQTEKDWVLSQINDLTNVKTVAEYEAEQNANN